MRFASGVLAIALLVAGCGESEEEVFAEAIQNNLPRSMEPCFRIQEMTNATFPLRVLRPLGAQREADLNPILAGMEARGLLSVEQQQTGKTVLDRRTVDIITITPEGEAADVWDTARGFCLGEPRVTEVVRYVYADQGANENAADVTFRWQIENRPDWAEPSAFPGVRGLAGSFETTAALQKALDGWLATIRSPGQPVP